MNTSELLELKKLEFEYLKKEQLVRIPKRDWLVYAVLGSSALVLALALNTKMLSVLLLQPPAAFLLGWIYLINDQKVSAIGAHIRFVLSAQLAGMLDVPQEEIFTWETAHRCDQRRRSRKLLQLGVDLLAFCVSPILVVVVVSSTQPGFTWLLGVAVVEAVAIVVLAWQFLLYAEL